MIDHDDWHTWIANNPCPSLQELVARHGGWHLITAAAWEEYDRAREEWDAKRKERLNASYVGLKRRV